MLNIGMLWKDEKLDKPLQDKVIDGVKYYIDKYHQLPNACHVNPTDLDNSNLIIDDTEPKISYNNQTLIKLYPDNLIFRNHMWIGIEDV